jgi:hypothetical protein
MRGTCEEEERSASAGEWLSVCKEQLRALNPQATAESSRVCIFAKLYK